MGELGELLPMPDLMLGVDGGTESLRAAVFDLEGRMLGDHSSPYGTEFPRPNWAEQDPADWWTAMGEACRGALKDAGVRGGDIAAVCADTTCCTVVFSKKDGEPLRPCLLWMDVRASDQARQVLGTGDGALRVNCGGEGPISAEWMVPKSLWAMQNEPDTYEGAEVVCEYQDWLNHKMTGRWCASLNNVSQRWHYSSAHGGWPTGLLAAVGMEDLQGKWPQDVIAPGEVIGGLTAEAADHTGLPKDLPVVQGGADALMGIVGLGLYKPGELTLITGSSHLQFMVCDREYHSKGVWGTFSDSVYPGRNLLEGGQTSTGSVINWFKRNFAPDASYDELNAEARDIPPGCDGLLSQDHFQGNRMPYTDPHSKGALVGLSLSHTRAHVYRAIIEGVCLGTKLVNESFKEAGEINRVVVAGGATNSDLWLQIHADTMGLDIERTRVPEAPLLGDAILAAKGVGKFGTIEEGCDAMVHTIEDATVRHDKDRAMQYQGIFERYRDLYGALRPFSRDGQGSGEGS